MIVKSKIKFKSFNIYKLEEIIKLLVESGKNSALDTKMISLTKSKKRFTILKGPHVHKKARDQYELTTHSKVLYLKGNKEKIKEFLTNLEQNLIEDITYSISFERT